MKKLIVGQEVALVTGYGRPKLGDPYGRIVKAIVIEVDPLTTAIRRDRRPPPDDVIYVERLREYSLPRYDDHVRDPQGKPLKGFVLVSYMPFTLKGNVIGLEAVKKSKVIGTWEEHQVLIRQANEAEKRQATLDDQRRAWDIQALKALAKEFKKRGVTASTFTEADGIVSLDTASLLKLFGLDHGERP